MVKDRYQLFMCIVVYVNNCIVFEKELYVVYNEQDHRTDCTDITDKCICFGHQLRIIYYRLESTALPLPKYI
jgi:hypothetical protein